MPSRKHMFMRLPILTHKRNNRDPSSLVIGEMTASECGDAVSLIVCGTRWINIVLEDIISYPIISENPQFKIFVINNRTNIKYVKVTGENDSVYMYEVKLKNTMSTTYTLMMSHRYEHQRLTSGSNFDIVCMRDVLGNEIVSECRGGVVHNKIKLNS